MKNIQVKRQKCYSWLICELDRGGSSEYLFRPVDYKQLSADICSVEIFFTFNEATKEVETTIYTGNGSTFLDKKS